MKISKWYTYPVDWIRTGLSSRLNRLNYLQMQTLLIEGEGITKLHTRETYAATASSRMKGFSLITWRMIQCSGIFMFLLKFCKALKTCSSTSQKKQIQVIKNILNNTLSRWYLFKHDNIFVVDTCALRKDQKRVCVWVFNVFLQSVKNTKTTWLSPLSLKMSVIRHIRSWG